jgi:integral membrane protein (TIGR01906 family)
VSPTVRVLAGLTIVVIALVTPGILVVNGIRVVARDWVVPFEYDRDGFPDARYGLARDEREELALLGLASILPGGDGLALLRDARLPDGTPAFGADEIAHMQDVRSLLGRALRVQLVVLLALLAAAIAFARTPLRRVVPRGLLVGALGTLVVAALAVPAILLGFDDVFVGFHGVFFEGDSWRFPRSATLIRIYPERFWADVFQLVAALTLAQVAIVAPAAWLWLRRLPRAASR